jgi:hypothetical protein
VGTVGKRTREDKNLFARSNRRGTASVLEWNAISIGYSHAEEEERMYLSEFLSSSRRE